MLTSGSLFQTPFDERGRYMCREEVTDEDRLFQASPQVTGIGETPEIHKPSPEPDLEEEEKTMCLSWRQILRLLTRRDPLIQYTTWLDQLEAAINVPRQHTKCRPRVFARGMFLNKCVGSCFSADTTNHSTYVETVNECYVTP